MGTKRFFGAHVSAAGGLENAAANGKRLGVNTIQIHPSPPQRWNSKPYSEGIETRFNEERKGSCVEKVFFHGIYLINLANPDPQQFHLSKISLVHYLELNAKIGGDGVIFHVGSMKNQPSDKEGYAQAAAGVDWILESSKGGARLIMEVAAGSGSIIGDRMEELAEIYSLVRDKSRVGFALDTQHLWASGYDYASDLDGFVGEVEKIFGLDKVWAIHMNDSKSALGSRVDRHENLGDGTIGADTLTRFFNHPKLSDIPFILETPALKEMDGAKNEVDKLNAMVAKARG